MPVITPREVQTFKKYALFFCALFLAIVALTFKQNNQLYLMATILLIVPLLSYGVGTWMLRGMAAVRRLPPSCMEGERIAVTLTVSNVGLLPKFLLRVGDRLPRGARAIGEAAPLILSLSPGEAAEATYLLEADRRGAHLLGPTEIGSGDLLGLFQFSQPVGEATELLVYPRPIPLNRSFLTGASSWGWRDQENSLTRGSGIDFHGVRDYQPGDELRRIHWRTTARTGKLAVTEFTQGYASDVLIALDLNREAYLSTGTGKESALEYAIKIAASLVHHLLEHGHAVQILTPGRESTIPTSDPSVRLTIMEALARAEADSEVTLAALLSRVAPQLSPGASLVYLTPDTGSSSLATALLECQARGAQPYGFVLDSNSFREGRDEGLLAPVILPGIIQRVARGADLQSAIEGMGDGRK